MIATIEAYFDESVSDDASPVLTVAGYIMNAANARTMDSKWRRVLIENGNLPYFRMSDCAHGSPPFDRLSAEERDAVARQIIALIAAHATMGVGISVNEAEYAELVWKYEELGDAGYSFCARQCITSTRVYLEDHQFFGEGDVAYFFEAGHRSQKQANAIMNDIFDDETRRREYRYGAHAFIPKDSIPSLQAADLLAWHVHTYRKRQARGEKRFRKDFQALCTQVPHKIIHMTRDKLIEFRDAIAPVSHMFRAG